MSGAWLTVLGARIVHWHADGWRALTRYTPALCGAFPTGLDVGDGWEDPPEWMISQRCPACVARLDGVKHG